MHGVPGRGRTQFRAGSAQIVLGRPTHAEQALQAAVDGFRKANAIQGLESALANLAMLRLEADDVESARALYSESVAVRKALEGERYDPDSDGALAEIEFHAG